MTGELVLQDLASCRRSEFGTGLMLNMVTAQRDSGIRIVGVCENGAGGFTVFAETSDPNSLETLRRVCQKQVKREVRVETDRIWLLELESRAPTDHAPTC